jgi:glycosyltransferase involved in cell wall biosynthesis
VVSLRIAIIGTRGVPPQYGGFETFAAELGTRLVQRGHDVTVYCRKWRTGNPACPDPDDRQDCLSPTWNGIHRIVLPAIPHKYLETVSHAFLSAVDAARRRFDVVLVCNAANAFVLPILRAMRFPVAINVDGIERRRRKWNILGRMVYASGEALSVSFANRVVADADVIASYYREQFSINPTVIPYGAEFPAEGDTDVLERLGLRPQNYILYVSRFEPENNPLEVVQAYETIGARVSSPAPLVMVGSGLYAKALVEELHSHASMNILFPGAIYGGDYRTLQRNALFYVQATEVGGTHPAMIEAMAAGGAVLAHDTPENREVGGDTVGYFRLRPEETLSGALRNWLMHPEEPGSLRARARERAARLYSWSAVTDAYERLFRDLAGS